MTNKLQLQDIQGLDHISFWPLAPGWWALAAVVTIVIAFSILAYRYQQRRRAGLRLQIMKSFERLAGELSPATSAAIATELALTMRRLAIRRFSRAECASLRGRTWLEWLLQNDPANYNWTEARFLLEAPYGGEGRQYSVASIEAALHAAKGWVR